MKHLLRSGALPTALLAALTMVRPLGAQDPASPPARTSRAGGIPREVVLSATRLFNAPGTRRVRGDFTLAAGDTVRGDVAVLGGRAQVDGVITGQLLVLNGSALVSGTCRIDGDLTVLGGAFESRERPALGGAIGVWSARYRYHEEADTLVADLDGEWIARWTGWQPSSRCDEVREVQRFMGRSQFLSELHTDHEPQNRKSLEINGTILRFMERSQFLSELHTDDEPQNRKSLEINGSILRFMESSQFLLELHTDHEPGPVGRARSPSAPMRKVRRPRRGRPTEGRQWFMESFQFLLELHTDHEPRRGALTLTLSRWERECDGRFMERRWPSVKDE